MMLYLQHKVSQIREIIEREGVSYLLKTVNVGSTPLPRYTAEFCLDSWEFDEIMVELGRDPTNPTQTL